MPTNGSGNGSGNGLVGLGGGGGGGVGPDPLRRNSNPYLNERVNGLDLQAPPLSPKLGAAAGGEGLLAGEKTLNGSSLANGNGGGGAP